VTARSTESPLPLPVPTRVSGDRARRAIRAAAFAFAALVTIDAVVGEEGLLALREARRMDAALRRALDKARADNARLRAHVTRLREQGSTIETVARQDLGLVKPGEILFIIKNPPTSR